MLIAFVVALKLQLFNFPFIPKEHFVCNANAAFIQYGATYPMHCCRTINLSVAGLCKHEIVKTSMMSFIDYGICKLRRRLMTGIDTYVALEEIKSWRLWEHYGVSHNNLEVDNWTFEGEGWKICSQQEIFLCKSAEAFFSNQKTVYGFFYQS